MPFLPFLLNEKRFNGKICKNLPSAMMKYLPYIPIFLLGSLLFGGCGTTKFSDTTRTATEQLLISSAMDDAIDEVDFYPLTGRKVFIQSDGVSATDKGYLLSILRQQLSANGVWIQEDKEKADYILEVSTGAVGTDRYELVWGTKESTIPNVLSGASTTIPEIALAKRTDQKAKVKLVMWAYNKDTGAIIWQSGEKNKVSTVRDRWILGMGPITKSSFNKRTQISGDDVPFNKVFNERITKDEKPSVKTEATYRELDESAINRLEKIRQEGLTAMVVEEKASEENVNEESKDQSQAAESGTEEQKPEEAPKPETPEQADAKPSPSTNNPPASPSAPADSGKISSHPEETGKAISNPPASLPETVFPPLPELEFDHLTLPAGKTVVPANRY